MKYRLFIIHPKWSKQSDLTDQIFRDISYFNRGAYFDERFEVFFSQFFCNRFIQLFFHFFQVFKRERHAGCLSMASEFSEQMPNFHAIFKQVVSRDAARGTFQFFRLLLMSKHHDWSMELIGES